MGKYVQLRVIPQRASQIDLVKTQSFYWADFLANTLNASFSISVEDTENELIDTGETIRKVFEVLRDAGIDDRDAQDMINAMQNEGIYFRERSGNIITVKTPEEPLEKN